MKDIGFNLGIWLTLNRSWLQTSVQLKLHFLLHSAVRQFKVIRQFFSITMLLKLNNVLIYLIILHFPKNLRWLYNKYTHMGLIKTLTPQMRRQWVIRKGEKQNKLLPFGKNSVIALTVDQPWLWASRQPEQIMKQKGNTSMDRLYLLHCDPSEMCTTMSVSSWKSFDTTMIQNPTLNFFPYIWYMLQWYNVVIHTFSKLYPIYSYYEIFSIFPILCNISLAYLIPNSTSNPLPQYCPFPFSSPHW